jgi:hypothetical protein
MPGVSARAVSCIYYFHYRCSMDSCSTLSGIVLLALIGKGVWTVYLATKHPETFRKMEERKLETKKTLGGMGLGLLARFLKK